ncbi:hypothetical protein Pth03_35080 [Planotetraspora thailandica]|uniref:Alanine-rich protein n=1 Tax=Planotetraspora thailandica TaxID=487172 RepID=A0A8J3UZV2_9ACTN|nr:hypothetical protein [Planotetraspora thailandica]GII55119.1 hypothetical protein Pth03_35080 [Planotetraspora thailandica]
MNVIYAYPWDVVGDPSAAGRLKALGADAVALAASYHTTRAATPRHPAHRLVDARHSACYVPVREEAWKDRRLVPAAPSWMETADPFGDARDMLRAEGLPVHAWTVLTHNSLLGSANPGLVVTNAFGEPYAYALCPASADVRDYCRTLVHEVVELGAPDALILEACGALGFRHGGHHEKTDGADWSPAQTALLSLCFCAACQTRYTGAGIDPAVLRARVCAAVDLPPRSVTSVDEALGDLAEAVRDVRTGMATILRDLLVREARSVRPGIPVTLHASADPWATGPFATVPEGVDVDVLVGNCWNAVEVDEAGLRALGRLGPRVGAYLLALPPRPADPAALSWLVETYTAAGAQEIHWYHGGLASTARLEAIGAAISR